MCVCVWVTFYSIISRQFITYMLFNLFLLYLQLIHVCGDKLWLLAQIHRQQWNFNGLFPSANICMCKGMFFPQVILVFHWKNSFHLCKSKRTSKCWLNFRNILFNSLTVMSMTDLTVIEIGPVYGTGSTEE